MKNEMKKDRYLVPPSKRIGCRECDHVQAHLPQSGTVKRVFSCGCEIKGNGLLESPWHIHYCPMHSAAAELRAACGEAFRALEYIRSAGDAQDWQAVHPLHKAHRMTRKAMAKAKGGQP